MDTAAWHTLDDIAAAARAALDPGAWDHLATGAEDEASIRLAREAFARWAFLPRILRPTRPAPPAPEAGFATGPRILGQELPAPLLVAPVGTHGLFHPAAEPATVAGAARAGALPVVSSMASAPFARIGAGGHPWCIQLYPFEDRELVRAIAREAIEGGAVAAVFTADVPVLGRRLRDRRHGFRPGVDARPYLQDELSRRGWTSFWDGWSAGYGWADVAALCGDLDVPVAVKGVLHPADAVHAVEAGAAAVWVSSHGGRQLDHAVAPLDVLPAVVREVAGAVPIVLDGEVRSGADAAKALALGAAAVAVGRPALWGLAAGGEEGVARTVELLVEQLANVVTLAGAATPRDLTPDHLVRVGEVLGGAGPRPPSDA